MQPGAFVASSGRALCLVTERDYGVLHGLARLTTLVNLYKALGGGWIEHTGDTPRAAEVHW